MKQSRILGLTGKIGAGKSTIANILKDSFGFEVIDVDNVYHQMLINNRKLKDELILNFGTRILENGIISRQNLRAITICSKENLELLNKITHPLILNEVQHILEKLKSYRIVIDAALLFQIGLDKLCNIVWFVDCDENVLIERVKRRNNYKVEEIQSFLKNQKAVDHYKAIANRVITNNTDIEKLKIMIAEYLKEDGLV